MRRGVSHVPEGRGIFPDLTVNENLMIGAYVRRGQNVSADYGRVMAMFPADRTPRAPVRLHAVRRRAADAGDRPRADGRAQVLLADELSLGLAPIIVKQVFAKLDEVRKAGITVLVVEQNARLAMKFADYLYVLKYGRVVMEGARRKIRTFDRSGRCLSRCLNDARLSAETTHHRTSARGQGRRASATGPG